MHPHRFKQIVADEVRIDVLPNLVASNRTPLVLPLKGSRMYKRMATEDARRRKYCRLSKFLSLVGSYCSLWPWHDSSWSWSSHVAYKKNSHLLCFFPHGRWVCTLQESDQQPYAFSCDCATRPYIVMFCWQGPVFLAEYLALCDSAIEAASLLCPTGIALGIIVIFLCPIGFLMIAAVYVRHHLRTESLVYEQNSRPSFSELKVWMKNSARVHESRATEPTSDNNAS